MDRDDTRLIQDAFAGDESAYAELVRRHRQRVYALALRMVRNVSDAEDLAQEAFLRAFRALPTVDLTRPFVHWLLRITTNACLDYHRRRKARPELLGPPPGIDEDDWEPKDADLGPLPDHGVESRESGEWMERLLAGLPPHYRAVITLRYVEDLSYEEIASLLGLPLGTVKAQIHRAHAQVRKRIEAHPR